jgi:hypothetical protein
MAFFDSKNYAPPGVFTRTQFENPIAGALETFKIPVFIGEGNEYLTQNDLEIVRGSSSTVDQRIVGEDETGRAVVSISQAGAVTLGAYDGILDKIQVHKFPITDGSGTGRVATGRGDVLVTFNNQPVVVRALDGTNGIIQVATPPKLTDLVRVTYYFKRTDTQITDDLSDQVSPDPAIVRGTVGVADANSPVGQAGSIGYAEVINLHGDITNSQGQVVVPANNVLSLAVDGIRYTITISPRTDYTMAQIASAITAAGAGTLVGSSFINNYGLSALQLSADSSIVVYTSTANAPLGLQTGQADLRTSTFYTFQGPIVDGSNGGVTTTDPAHVTVRVDGRQVIPSSVDGANRAVVLPYAPKAGSRVAVTYWFNAWQDTFDYLANYGVTEITKCGDVPGGSSYTQDADFILKDSLVVWGTASLISSGVNTQGSERFDSTQVTANLIDNRTYLSACTEVAGGGRLQFLLPFEPTLGNGRDTPLGQSLFQTVSNGRIDLPVDRPDVIFAYWGFDVQDALERGRVTVLKVVDGVITLSETVPVGANVYATFWHNLLTDNTFTLTCVNPGVSSVGTYSIQDQGENDIFGATYDMGTKGASLNGITIEFPSGSEWVPDLHFEGLSGNDFSGPVEEIVTVQFASRDATPAKWTVPGAGPYEFIKNQSDRLNVKVHSVPSGDAGINLTSPVPESGQDGGFFASLVSEEIVYTGGTGSTRGKSYSFDSSEEFSVIVDQVTVSAKTSSGTPFQNQTIGYLATVLNEAAGGHTALAQGAGTTDTIVLRSTSRSNVNNYYVGWRVVIGNGAAAITAGQTRTITAYDGTTGIATIDGVWSGGGATANNDPYHIYNPSARSVMVGATEFNGPVTITAGHHDRISLVYGDLVGNLIFSAQLGASTYATPNELAIEVQDKIQAVIDAAVVATDRLGLAVEVAADASGRLEFRLQLPGKAAAGFIQFLNAATVAQDFSILAGLDTAAAVKGGQAMLLQGPVARTYECPDANSVRPYDRLILRNRLTPGGGAGSSMDPHWNESQMSLEVQVGNEKAGLVSGAWGEGGKSASVRPATTMGRVGFSGGMNGLTGEPVVTFYDGAGVVAANNVFSFTMDGTPVTATFTGSSTGTATDLGPVSSAASVLGQIAAAMAAVPGAPFGTLVNIRDTLKLVRQEGAGIRFTGTRTDTRSRIVIGSGSANSVLGFSAGTIALRETVSARKTASALMADSNTNSIVWWLSFTSVTNHFANNGIASVETDASGSEYLYLQDTPTVYTNLGAASTIRVSDTTGSIQNALSFNTGLNIRSGSGAAGESALDGYFVISNITDGSGSINTSILNNGIGQDGIVGQTYRDEITGLTFTILPRGWGSNQIGPWLSYPTGANATFRFNVSKTFVTNANLPINALNGVELTVSNTDGVGIGDTALVETFERGGQEPVNGDLYYVSYVYQKEAFTTAFYTKLSAIEAAYGTESVNNPLTLAAYLSIINGAVLVGLTQVPREEGQQYASLASYRNAIDSLEGTLPGFVKPDEVIPLRGDSTDLYQYLKRSNELMSSVRYKSERTSIIGVAAGTLPEAAGTLAQALGDMRMRLVYPDIAVITLTDNTGASKEELVDGPMIAAGLAGSVVSPNLDVATPWTGRRLVGYTQLGRVLDMVEQNQLAQKGITILEDRPPFLRVRHGLTTDMTNNLTKLPTIVLIADEVQQQSRAALEPFIGTKFLPGILTQVEGRLAMTLKQLVKAQIISAYTGVKATVSVDDPTSAEISAYYSPVFPLLYLLLTFGLRSSL